MARAKYANDEVSHKFDLAQALVWIVARDWIGNPAREIYKRLEDRGWEWRGDGRYARVEAKSKEKSR